MLIGDQLGTRHTEKSMEGTKRDRFVMHAVLEGPVLAMVLSTQALFTLEGVAINILEKFPELD